MARSYQHRSCSICGKRTTNNGMGRDAHNHSRIHIDALKKMLTETPDDKTGVSGRYRTELSGEIEKLEREAKERNERRASFRK